MKKPTQHNLTGEELKARAKLEKLLTAYDDLHRLCKTRADADEEINSLISNIPKLSKPCDFSGRDVTPVFKK